MFFATEYIPYFCLWQRWDRVRHISFTDSEGEKHTYRYSTVSRIIDEMLIERNEVYRFAQKFKKSALGRESFTLVQSYDNAIAFAKQKKIECGERF